LVKLRDIAGLTVVPAAALLGFYVQPLRHRTYPSVRLFDEVDRLMP
jgi:hypothetical protein